MGTLQITCNRDECSFSDTAESYEEAEDICDNHHIPTGHRCSIDERGGSKYTLKCERHGEIDSTDHYKRAKSIRDEHHIVTGCNPVIED